MIETGRHGVKRRKTALSWIRKTADARLLTILEKPDVDAALVFDANCRIPVHSNVLAWSSEPLADMLEAAGHGNGPQSKELLVGSDDPEGWIRVLAHLYPIMPQITWASVLLMLPVVHKYNIRDLLAACQAWITSGQHVFSCNKGHAANVLRWLELGERLQLDTIKTKALAFVAAELNAGRTAVLRDRAGLSLLSRETHTEILLLVGSAARGGSGTKLHCALCGMRVSVQVNVLTSGTRHYSGRPVPTANFARDLRCIYCYERLRPGRAPAVTPYGAHPVPGNYGGHYEHDDEDDDADRLDEELSGDYDYGTGSGSEYSHDEESSDEH